jgi:mono/diheme cytochrome c family protein
MANRLQPDSTHPGFPLNPGLEDSPGALFPSPRGLKKPGSGFGFWSPLGDCNKTPGSKTHPGPTTRILIAAAALLSLLFTGCGEQWMADQPRYDTFEASPLFDDGLSARPLVPGTVSRGMLRDDSMLFTGRVGESIDLGEVAGVFSGVRLEAPYTDTFPFELNSQVLRRGQERYNIFCVVCHGYTGYGNGRIVERGYVRPPSYHEERLRKAPVGHFFDVITNGYGAMPMYRAEVPPRDRWAIIAYIRALQASQRVPESELTPKDRQAIRKQESRQRNSHGH